MSSRLSSLSCFDAIRTKLGHKVCLYLGSGVRLVPQQGELVRQAADVHARASPDHVPCCAVTRLVTCTVYRNHQEDVNTYHDRHENFRKHVAGIKFNFTSLTFKLTRSQFGFSLLA